MVIVYMDGGKLECSNAEFFSSNIIADDIYAVPFDEVDCIVESEEEV